MTESNAGAEWKLPIGGAIFVLSFVSPFVVVPLVMGSDLTTEWKSALSGLFAVGVPEVGMFVAVAIMGKPGFEVVKRGLLRPLARLLPSDEVSPIRYRVGLVLFSLPLLFGWLGPYAQYVLGAPSQWRAPLVGDIVFLSSFFVLGGNFWDKVRSLFDRTARVTFASR